MKLLLDWIKKMTKLSKTKRVLAEMLKENTGTALCDSGGYYGRHWQRNQGKDFETMPRSVVEFRVWKHGDKVEPEIMVTHNIYHWLESRLEFCPEMDKLFHGRFLKECDGTTNTVISTVSGTSPYSGGGEKSWMQLMNEFPEWLKTLKDRSRQPKYENITDYYGDGDPVIRYTYSEDNCLSQDVQYLYFEIGCNNYVALQIHGGCDARDGLTKPRLFMVDESCSELPMFDHAKASLYCSKDIYHPTALAIKQKQEDNSQLLLPGFNKPIGIDFDEFHAWDSDDGGCSWNEVDNYGNVSKGYNQPRDLSKYPVKDLDGDAEEDEDGNVIEQDVWEPGKLCIKDGVGYCPICGGKLESSFY